MSSARCSRSRPTPPPRSGTTSPRSERRSTPPPTRRCSHCIASLACERFEMDAWGVDVMVAACQKGLMTPPGLAFTFHGTKAEAARIRSPSPYWDWGPRTAPEAYYQLFCGTAPTHHLYGLRTALDMILKEEGLEGRVGARHAVFAHAIWAAVEGWGARGALELNMRAPELRSRAVTTIRTAPGDGSRLRQWCSATAGPDARNRAHDEG